MTGDRPFLGILLMLGFCALAPMGDSLAKLLGETVPLLHMVAVRFLVQVVILLPLVWASRRALTASARVTRLTFVRTLLHISGLGAMFASLRFLPIADAIAIAFVMPFIMLLLGRSFLGEHVGPHRLMACAVGFLGTLLVIQPNFADVGWPALLPVAVAVVFAFFMLVTRQIAKEVDPISLQAHSGLMALAILVPLTLIAPAIDLAPTVSMPRGIEAGLLLSMGALGTVAHLLMTWSLRFAPSATLAPMQYLEIPIATFFGWVIFSDLPDGLAAIGIVITIGAGLYIILRERALSRSAAV